jgi:hypothetical protein
LVYQPAAFGAGVVHFVDAALTGDQQRPVLVVAPITDDAIPVDWDKASLLDMPLEDLSQQAEGDAVFAPLPSSGGQAASYKMWRKDLATWLYRTQSLDLLESPQLKMSANPGETEGEFRVRLQLAAREQRDSAIDKLRESYGPKLQRIEESIRKAEQAVEREQEQAKGAKLQTAISLGATLLSAFTGRKKLSATTLGRATTAARGVSRSLDQAGDVDRAAESVEAKMQRKMDLAAEFEAEVAALQERLDASALELTTRSVKPRKTDVDVALVGLAWLPYRISDAGDLSPAWS